MAPLFAHSGSLAGRGSLLALCLRDSRPQTLVENDVVLEATHLIRVDRHAGRA